MPQTVRSLEALFDPRSVAVVGASNDPAKWGYGVAVQLLAHDAPRRVHLVNRRGVPVLGRPTLRRLTEAADTVELVVIAVPAAGFLDAVRDALAVGARAIVAITAGMGESDAGGRQLEQEALALVREQGTVLIGPNCLGVVDTTTGLSVASDPVTPGSVALLSQSGNLVLDLDAQLAAAGLGVSRLVSVGNQLDVTLAELVRDCADHAGTAAIAVYAEDLRDGRELVAAGRYARDAGKPLVVLAPGRSEAGSRGAASHTGALTSPARVVDAVCRAAGAYRVESPAEMTVVLKALMQAHRAAGPRVAILTDGGGHGAIAADVVSAHGLAVPALSTGLGARLRAALWEPSPVANPVDLAGIGEQDPASYARAVDALLASDEVDAVLMTGYFGGYAEDPASGLGGQECDAAREIGHAVSVRGKPVVVHSIYPHSESVAILAASGLPAYRHVEDAATALRALVLRAPVDDDLALPPPQPPLPDTGYQTVRGALAAAGVSFPPARFVRDRDDAAAAAGELGFPLVLKAMGLLHKSDSGGVVLDLHDTETLLRAYDDVVARLRPPAVSIEGQVMQSGVEVIVGVRTDPHCGPVALVGLGGVYTEVFDDVACALAPVTPTTAKQLLLSLRSAPLLTGTRGSEGADVDALAATIAAVSRFAAAHPELGDVEVNPVLASSTGAVALDARAIAAP